MISDYFSYHHQFFLNWSIATGLMGLIMWGGYYKVTATDRTEIRGFLVLAVVAVALSGGFAVLIEIYLLAIGVQCTMNWEDEGREE